MLAGDCADIREITNEESTNYFMQGSPVKSVIRSVDNRWLPAAITAGAAAKSGR